MYKSKLLVAVSASCLGIGGILGATFQQKQASVCVYHNKNIDNCQNDSDLSKFRYILPLPTVTAASAPIPSNLPAHPVSPVNRAPQIMKHGFPGLDNIKTFDDYVLSYDKRNRTANWVFEHLTKENVKKIQGIERDTCNFTEDLSIHPYFRSTNRDYKGSGYDRGHLAAAGNHRQSQKSMEQTFHLSNMSPQVSHLLVDLPAF